MYLGRGKLSKERKGDWKAKTLRGGRSRCGREMRARFFWIWEGGKCLRRGRVARKQKSRNVKERG